MKRIGTALSILFAAVVILICTSFDGMCNNEETIPPDIFEGTSPCATSAKSFLGIPPSKKCDFIKWQVIFNYDQQTKNPSHYKLSREYAYHIDNRTSQPMGIVSIEGRWEITKGTKSLPQAIVYRLYSGKESISFIKVDENLIHLLEADQTFSTAATVQTFTLSRKGNRRASAGAFIKVSTPVSAKEKLSEIRYVGRTPCKEIASEINIQPAQDCFKLKWSLTLKFDPKTHEPSVYELARTLHRHSLIKGKWRIIRGSPSDPDAIIYQLDPDKPKESILLLRADGNVLFFLDKKRNPLVGNAEFSYTLNRG